MNFRNKFDFESDAEYDALRADFEAEQANSDRQKREAEDRQRPKPPREDAAYLRQLEEQAAVNRENNRGLYAKIVSKLGIQWNVDHEFRRYPVPCPSPSKSGTIRLWVTQFYVVGSEADHSMCLLPNNFADYVGQLYLKHAATADIGVGVEGLLYFTGDSGIPRIDVAENYVFVIGFKPDKIK